MNTMNKKLIGNEREWIKQKQKGIECTGIQAPNFVEYHFISLCFGLLWTTRRTQLIVGLKWIVSKQETW